MSRERRLQQVRDGWRRRAGGIALVVAGISAAAVLVDGPSWRSMGTVPRMLAGHPADATTGDADITREAGIAEPGMRPDEDIAGAPPGAPEFRPLPESTAFPGPLARLALPDDAQQGRPLPMHEFYFTRAAYSGGGGGFRRWRRQSWATDYPKSDRQFLIVAERLTGLDMFMEAHPRELTDEHLNRFPFLYALEVGYMSMTPEEATALREYLLRGGFLVIDDFWGTYEWEVFEYEMQKVLPEYPIVDVPLDHEIFHTFYDINEIVQVPNVGNGRGGWRTHERDGYEPFVKGIFDDEGRLMVIINWNTDLGDAWEWAEDPYYPLKYSTYAIQMGVNFIIYAMSH